jgi:hypothetical protein
MKTAWKITGALLVLSPIVTAFAQPAGPDWSTAPKSEITLFYPGQASQQWLMGKDHAKGAKAIAQGRNCLYCHEGEEAEKGKLLVSGEKLEPKPIAGKTGSIKVTMQAAFDKDYLYMKASWPTKDPGMYHEYAVFRNGKWETYATNRANPNVASGKLKASYEDRFSIMLGDGKSVPAFNNQGCWVTCHNDMRYMPNETKKADIDPHPILGTAGLKKDDIRKYLPETRTAMGETGGWDKIKSIDEINAMKTGGAFLELWQWRGYRSNPAGAADDGYVLEYRNLDAGTSPFFNNWDGAKNEPRFVYNPATNNGRVALNESEFRNPKAPVLNEKNRIKYDQNQGWKDGDIIPKYGSSEVKGSAGDNAPVVGTWDKGMWTVVWRRKLNTGNNDDIAIKAGERYPIGLAIHDDNATARFHHVSFPLTMSLGGRTGDINAVQVR